MTNFHTLSTAETYQSIEPTAEQFARDLGASVRFSMRGVVAFNFPTKQSSLLFAAWLLARGYMYNWNEEDWKYSVTYLAPQIATSSKEIKK